LKEAIYRIMVCRGIAFPAYEQILNEQTGKGSPPPLMGGGENPNAAGFRA